ncbi:hypothetical protein [Acinetobacter sp.]|uniref:hypothetical protein n=1 Tax=Acinetobacter sp. TaxID=472 RepID=UPI00388F4F14
MTFSSLTLRPGDIILMKVNVGQLPPELAKKYMKSIKKDFKKVLGADQQIIMIASKDEPSEICILNLA